jgi:hypothetical protein
MSVLTSCAEDCSQIDGKTLRPKREGQDFDRVCDGQWSESNVVEGEEDEQEGDCSAASSFDGVFRESGTERCNSDERDQHTAGRKEPERATAKAFCTHGTAECEESIPELEGKVDASLCNRACDAYALQNGSEIVCRWLVHGVRAFTLASTYKTRFRCLPTGS